MNNTYTYKAKRIDYKDNKENQYVTGNIITIGARCFVVNPEFTYDYDCGYSYESPGISFDNCGFIEVDRNTIEPFIDQKQTALLDVITELTYLTDATTNEELAALCDACDYDYDTLSEWNKESKLQIQGSISSNFARALDKSYYNDNALIDYAKHYKEFMNEPSVKSKNIKLKISDREL